MSIKNISPEELENLSKDKSQKNSSNYIPKEKIKKKPKKFKKDNDELN